MLEFATFTNAPYKRFSGDCDDGLQQAYGRLSQLIEGLFRRRKQTLQLGEACPFGGGFRRSPALFFHAPLFSLDPLPLGIFFPSAFGGTSFRLLTISLPLHIV